MMVLSRNALLMEIKIMLETESRTEWSYISHNQRYNGNFFNYFFMNETRPEFADAAKRKAP